MYVGRLGSVARVSASVGIEIGCAEVSFSFVV